MGSKSFIPAMSRPVLKMIFNTRRKQVKINQFFTHPYPFLRVVFSSFWHIQNTVKVFSKQKHYERKQLRNIVCIFEQELSSAFQESKENKRKNITYLRPCLFLSHLRQGTCMYLSEIIIRITHMVIQSLNLLFTFYKLFTTYLSYFYFWHWYSKLLINMFCDTSSCR